MIKTFAKVAAPAVAAFVVVAFGAMTPREAAAGEFCRQDVTGHMTSCGFSSMEQCKAASAGIGGDCFRDPFIQDNQNALAYQPAQTQVKKKRTRSHGSEASSHN
jgi:hypothetical protein